MAAMLNAPQPLLVDRLCRRYATGEKLEDLMRLYDTKSTRLPVARGSSLHRASKLCPSAGKQARENSAHEAHVDRLWAAERVKLAVGSRNRYPYMYRTRLVVCWRVFARCA